MMRLSAGGQFVPTPPLTMMAVHAHPDDETLSTGGLLARTVDEGNHAVVVCCTRGEAGEILDPDLVPDEVRDRLGAIREEELRKACAELGVKDVYFLDYRDSGMAATPENDRPDNFHNAPIDEAVGRLVKLIRQCRPDVLVTYDERGSYGHPDHIKAHLVTLAAFDAAGDGNRYPEDGLEAWQPRKLYYTVFARTDFMRFIDLMRQYRLEWPDEGQEQEDDFDPAELTYPDEVITTRVDVSAYGERVRTALALHRTQIPENSPFLRMPVEGLAETFGKTSLIRVRSLVPAPEKEDSIWAGLTEQS
jgi:N-acetyl-1-D-myo-inositol-2-amino-2-deoxy-alpha-D-glucopyranoside deacetylase